MRYYHGTNFDAGISIIKNGFTSGKIWSVSDANDTYMINELYDNHDAEYTEFETLPAVRFAIEAGQTAAAHHNQLSNDIFVFEFNIPDDMELDPDETNGCPSDSYSIDNTELNTLIENGHIHVTIYKLHNAYEPYLRVFYLTGLVDNPYYNFTDKQLKTAVTAVAQSDQSWFFDEYLAVYESYEKSEIAAKIAA